MSAEPMVIRVVMKVRTSAKDDVARDLRVRLKRALDEMDLRLPSLTSVVLSGFDGATRVKGAKPPKTAPNPVLEERPPSKRSLRAKRAAASISGAGSVPSDPAPTTTLPKPQKPPKAPKTPKATDAASDAVPKDTP